MGDSLHGPMISKDEVRALRTKQAVGGAVLSLYLRVPVEPAALRGLATRAGDLMVTAGSGVGRSGVALSDADRNAVLGIVAQYSRDWLGRTVAIFACGEINLLAAMLAPGPVLERAVLAARPHLRPLIAALQRSPDYRVAVAGRRNASVFSVCADQVEVIATPETDLPRSQGYGGWYGLQAHRVQQRINNLARDHYRNTAAILEREAASDRRPLVIGGQQEAISHLLHALRPGTLDDLAGTFTADPNSLTPARVRERGGAVIERWADRRERKLSAEILSAPPGKLAAVGLAATSAAVNAGAVNLLLIPDNELVPGFECGECGALCSTADECPGWDTSAQPLPDLLEEMAWRTLDAGGQVITVRETPFSAAAKLRFSVGAATRATGTG